MLVLRRKIGESLRIGSDIEIQVIEIGSSRVKLGITAPPQVLILRTEVLLAGEQNRAAVLGATPEAARDLLSSLNLPATSK